MTIVSQIAKFDLVSFYISFKNQQLISVLPYGYITYKAKGVDKMKLSASVRDVITKKIGLSIEEISTMSAERLDKHIEKEVIKKPLVVKRVREDFVPARGCVLRTIKQNSIDAEIKSMLGA